MLFAVPAVNAISGAPYNCSGEARLYRLVAKKKAVQAYP